MKEKINIRHLALACLIGLGVAGCGSDNSDKPKNAEVTIEKQISAYIQSTQGVALKNVQITVAGKTVTTDENGLADFSINIPKSTRNVVVRLSKSGFINQSILVDVKDLTNITANMLLIKQNVNVQNIEDAQVIESAYNNATITIPANAFIKPDGTPATGAITVEFTPWDISTEDLNAMPANGVAQNANGQIVNLISAGMITAIFKDADGTHLQLAEGKTADIQMDLPLESINNQGLTAGSEIPMWHFDESKGLWVEEGKGVVVSTPYSQTSPFGLAVKATVSHFSTWNWDFEFSDTAGQVNVKCKSGADFIPCHITAKVELADGSGFTKTSSISAEGTIIVNMPSSGSIQWTAKDTSGTLIGEQTSGVTGNVEINLGEPTTKNFVKCVTEENVAIACSGTVNGLSFAVPKEGGKIITGLENVTELLWEATSVAYTQGTAVYRSVGSKTSNISEDVTIILDGTTKLFDQMSIKLHCQSDENVPTCQVKLNGNYLPISTEQIDVSYEYFSKEYDIPLNQDVKVYLPIPPQDQANYVFVYGIASVVKNGLELQKRQWFDDIYAMNVLSFNLNEDTYWCDPTITYQDGEWENDNWIYPNGYPPCSGYEMPQ